MGEHLSDNTAIPLRQLSKQLMWKQSNKLEQRKTSPSIKCRRSCSIRWFIDPDKCTKPEENPADSSQVPDIPMTWKKKAETEGKREPALRGLRAPGCASHYVSCVKWEEGSSPSLCPGHSTIFPFCSCLICTQQFSAAPTITVQHQ